MPGRKQHQSAAFRRLSSCQGSISHQPCHGTTKCPAWGMGTLGVSQHQPHQPNMFDAGLQGQSVLALPLRNADLSVKLPPGLQLAATPAGHLDCRMQLLGAQLDWLATGSSTQSSGPPGSHGTPQVLPARSNVAGFACRTGALLLAHALFPDHTHHLLAWLAVPVAVADTLGVVASATPSNAQQAVRSRAQQLKCRLQRRPGPGRGLGWVDGVQGVVEGSLHTFRSLSGPAAVVATGGWLWSLVSPSSHMLCSAVVALMAVAADYNSLGRDVAHGRIPPGKAVEAAWRARHKAAAQRLAVYCGDLPSRPPLAPVIELVSHCSIAAGLAVGGQGLSGQLPPSLAAPTAAALTSDWPLGQCSTSCVGGRGSAGGNSMQLVLAGSVVRGKGWRGKEVHEAAGLSRSQLLELFTGRSQEDHEHDQLEAATVTAAALDSAAGHAAEAVAGGADVGSHSSSSSTTPTAAGPAALSPCPAGNASLPLLTSTVAAAGAPSTPGPCAGVRVLTDSGSERSVDAVIRIKQLQRDKPDTRHSGACGGSSSNCGSRAISWTSSGDVSFAAAAAGSVGDPLAFLDDLPLYGQQDHTHLLAAQAATAGAGVDPAKLSTERAVFDDAWGGMLEAVTLTVRGGYLLLVFAPFLLLGVPMLLLSWWLLTRAAQQQQQGKPATATSTTLRISSSSDSSDRERSSTDAPISNSKLAALKACVQRVFVSRPSELALQLLHQVVVVLGVMLTLLDLLLVLFLGGHWAAGVSAWESAGMWLRQQAWLLLHFSCSHAGAAFIKWAQWSSSRRDIFPADFCDVLCTFHDRAPVHSYRHTRRQVKVALGVDIEQLFDSFDATPLASGSIAQVHKATLKPDAYCKYIQLPPAQHQQQQQQHPPHEQQQEQVVVKVCHPSVAEHIRMDFKLVALLSAVASKLPMLRGLPLRESVAQFSHTMTAQTDLRVEAVHALRFHNNFAGVSNSVTIPRPIPGLVSSTVLVETFEAGQGVAVFMREPHAINTQIVALGVDTYLKMLLTDNFVHTDLHPGNILFRSLPAKQPGRRQQLQREREQQQQQQQAGRPWWQRMVPWKRTVGGMHKPEAGSSSSSTEADDVMPQWERELLALSAQHQQRWVSKHGAKPDSSSSSQQPLQATSSSSSDSGSVAPENAQLVLLDFGLAEQLTPAVRQHFISFLNAISAGDGLAASHHLLRWSTHQTCPDTRSFRRDMVDLFNSACDINSAQGIDLDGVMTSVLGLARQHAVTIDSCYASLVISVCVLVGFAKALDPEVNLMDAATPTLLAYALTGKVVGRLYS